MFLTKEEIEKRFGELNARSLNTHSAEMVFDSTVAPSYSQTYTFTPTEDIWIFGAAFSSMIRIIGGNGGQRLAWRDVPAFMPLPVVYPFNLQFENTLATYWGQVGVAASEDVQPIFYDWGAYGWYQEKNRPLYLIGEFGIGGGGVSMSSHVFTTLYHLRLGI